jgi:hypothetical protein
LSRKEVLGEGKNHNDGKVQQMVAVVDVDQIMAMSPSGLLWTRQNASQEEDAVPNKIMPLDSCSGIDNDGVVHLFVRSQAGNAAMQQKQQDEIG